MAMLAIKEKILPSLTWAGWRCVGGVPPVHGGPPVRLPPVPPPHPPGTHCGSHGREQSVRRARLPPVPRQGLSRLLPPPPSHPAVHQVYRGVQLCLRRKPALGLLWWVHGAARAAARQRRRRSFTGGGGCAEWHDCFHPPSRHHGPPARLGAALSADLLLLGTPHPWPVVPGHCTMYISTVFWFESFLRYFLPFQKLTVFWLYLQC